MTTADTDTADTDTDTADTDTDTTPAHRTRPLVPAALLVLAIAFVAIGAAFLVRAHSLDDDPAASNAAVVDGAATSQVIGQVSSALNEVLSYDYRKPEVSSAAAKKWLTGDAPKQYDLLFSQLQKLAPGQKLTLVAKVSTAGVTSLTGDHAQLLVFLDQQSTRASDKQTSVSAAQVQIGAVRSGGTWRIDELKPL